MYGKVKQLRRGGKRLSDHDIARAEYIEGEVRVYVMAGIIMANVSDPNSQVGEPLLPALHDAKLVTMNGYGLLFKGEERPQGDAGPAYIQEWSVIIAG